MVSPGLCGVLSLLVFVAGHGSRVSGRHLRGDTGQEFKYVRLKKFQSSVSQKSKYPWATHWSQTCLIGSHSSGDLMKKQLLAILAPVKQPCGRTHMCPQATCLTSVIFNLICYWNLTLFMYIKYAKHVCVPAQPCGFQRKQKTREEEIMDCHTCGTINTWNHMEAPCPSDEHVCVRFMHTHQSWNKRKKKKERKYIGPIGCSGTPGSDLLKCMLRRINLDVLFIQ